MSQVHDSVFASEYPDSSGATELEEALDRLKAAMSSAPEVCRKDPRIAASMLLHGWDSEQPPLGPPDILGGGSVIDPLLRGSELNRARLLRLLDLSMADGGPREKQFGDYFPLFLVRWVRELFPKNSDGSGRKMSKQDSSDHDWLCRMLMTKPGVSVLLANLAAEQAFPDFLDAVVLLLRHACKKLDHEDLDGIAKALMGNVRVKSKFASHEGLVDEVKKVVGDLLTIMKNEKLSPDQCLRVWDAIWRIAPTRVAESPSPGPPELVQSEPPKGPRPPETPDKKADISASGAIPRASVEERTQEMVRQKKAAKESSSASTGEPKGGDGRSIEAHVLGAPESGVEGPQHPQVAGVAHSKQASSSESGLRGKISKSRRRLWNHILRNSVLYVTGIVFAVVCAVIIILVWWHTSRSLESEPMQPGVGPSESMEPLPFGAGSENKSPLQSIRSMEQEASPDVHAQNSGANQFAGHRYEPCLEESTGSGTSPKRPSYGSQWNPAPRYQDQGSSFESQELSDWEENKAAAAWDASSASSPAASRSEIGKGNEQGQRATSSSGRVEGNSR